MFTITINPANPAELRQYLEVMADFPGLAGQTEIKQRRPYTKRAGQTAQGAESENVESESLPETGVEYETENDLEEPRADMDY